MIALEVKLNGKPVCIAGADDMAVLRADVTACASPARKQFPADLIGIGRHWGQISTFDISVIRALSGRSDSSRNGIRCDKSTWAPAPSRDRNKALRAVVPNDLRNEVPVRDFL